MSGSTAKYAVPYMTGGDGADGIDDGFLALATRLDLLLGESGTQAITPSAADTTTSVRVNYGRSYAALAPLVPKVQAVVNEAVNTASEVTVWTSGEDATGFTLNIRSSGTAARATKWRAGV